MEKLKDRNIILLFLSDYKTDKRENQYWFGEDVYVGTHTNDAPVKMLLKTAKEEGNPISDIFCIVSNDVMNTEYLIEGKSQSSFDRFEGKVGVWAAEFGYENEIDITPIPYDENLEYIAKRTQKLYHDLNHELPRAIPGENTVNVYIDYTGGFRDTTFFMTVIIRYLEFAGIACKRIIYSNLSRVADVRSELYDITYIYELFQLINGTSEFVSTGNASILATLYENTDNEDIRSVVNGLIDFSKRMSLCNVADIDIALESLINALTGVEQLLSSHEMSMNNEMFSSLLPLIRQKMGISEGSYKLSIPALIRWCTDNNMLQQAVTLYIEKMPEYYLENDMLPYSLFDWHQDVETTMGASQSTTKFYKTLYDSIIAQSDISVKLMLLLKTINTNEIKKNNTAEEAEEIILRKMNELRRNNPSFVAPLDEMISIMERIANAEKNSDKEFSYYGRKHSFKTAIGFYNKAADDRMIQHFFVYHDKAAYEKTANMGTHMKKADAIRQIKSLEFLSADEKEYLRGIMSYYELLKIIRNRLNHASAGEAFEEDESKALEYFIECGVIRSSDVINFDAVKEIIIDGLRASVRENAS